MTVVAVLAALITGNVFVMADHHSVARSPGSILNLNDWELQLPFEAPHSSQFAEVAWPALRKYSSWNFEVNSAGDGVALRAPAGGKTTPGARFARSELRQMTDNGTRPASWSSVGTTWSMTLREAITHLTPRRPDIVAGQIHGIGNRYIALVRLDGRHMWVKTEAGNAGTLDNNYQLGTIFTVSLVSSGDVISVYYNGMLKVQLNETCTGCYFKAGAYLQSNTKWDAPSAYGEVVIYDLTVSNS